MHDVTRCLGGAVVIIIIIIKHYWAPKLSRRVTIKIHTNAWV